MGHKKRNVSLIAEDTDLAGEPQKKKHRSTTGQQSDSPVQKSDAKSDITETADSPVKDKTRAQDKKEKTKKKQSKLDKKLAAYKTKCQTIDSSEAAPSSDAHELGHHGDGGKKASRKKREEEFKSSEKSHAGDSSSIPEVIEKSAGAVQSNIQKQIESVAKDVMQTDRKAKKKPVKAKSNKNAKSPEDNPVVHTGVLPVEAAQSGIHKGGESVARDVAQDTKEEKKKRLKKAKKKSDASEKDSVSETVDKSAEAAQYLTLWKKDRSSWRFRKHKQVWLLRHMYSPEQVSDKTFKVLLKYLEKLAGRAREVTIKEAQELLQKEETEGSASLEPTVQKRVRSILQLL